MSIRAATQTTSLGRYHVVKRLAAGGMADVLLARTQGIEGFSRHVVIKRIHADLSEEQRYVKMFLDEARLAASLHHANIVQVNDIGEENGEYFFAMEYVHGEDARTLLVEAHKRHQLIPLEHVITIVTAAAAGLHHAHEQRGPDRNPLHIVHRDVSPANILVGYDGGVKVADFGIAQAAHRAEQTQSGLLKGKVAYMSPEQCNCDPIDRRSDVFSLGIVLYELATVHPCFSGDNDYMTMSAIVAGNYERPSFYNPAIPPQLDAIIMKALAGSPRDRYPTADDMRIALERFAEDSGLRTSTTALADYMKAKFGSRPEPWLEESDDEELEISVDAIDDATDDDDLAIPTADPDAPNRGVKQTLPLRSLQTPAALALRASAPSVRPGARPTAIGTPVVRMPAPTTPIRNAPSRVAVATPSAAPVEAPVESTLAVRVPGPQRVKRLWLAGSVGAVVIAAALLFVVNRGDGSAASANTATPARATAPRPVAPSKIKTEPQQVEVAAPAPVAEPAPKKRPRKVKKPAATVTVEPAPAPKKKWDPDALFPK